MRRLVSLLALPVIAMTLVGAQAASANAATGTWVAAMADHVGAPAHTALSAATTVPCSPPSDLCAVAEFHNAWYDLCLQPEGNGSRVPVQQEPCQNTPYQNWHIGGSIGGEWYQIVNGENECLSVAGGSTSNGALIYAWPCLGPSDTNQYWLDTWAGVGYSEQYINYASRLYLSVDGCNDSPGAYIDQWGYVPLPGGYCQLWNWWDFLITS
jgi:hypothetical protein